MSNPHGSRQRALVIAVIVGLFLSTGVVTQIFAQGTAADRAAERRARQAERQQKEKEGQTSTAAMFPDATRQSPAVKASAKMTPKLQKLSKLNDDGKTAEVRAAADEIIGNSSANDYDRAIAAQIAAQSAYDADDSATAKSYLQKSLGFNGLDNNGHYQVMLMLAQLQLQDEQYAESLATLDKFLTETKSQKAEHLVLKGNALYRLERYPEAVAVLKQAVSSTPEPRADWLQLLMGAYFEMDKPAEAAKIAEELVAKNPNDKRLQMNMASIYMQADQNDKAIALLEKLRTSGQLTEDRDYRNLYALYLNTENKEKEAISVINDGIQKGILKPDHQTYLALAQAYYFSDQPAQSIEAYKKAAPLATDGETYLNLAKVLWQEGKVGEAKQAAQQALGKGVKKPDDAKKILALPGK